MDSSEETALAGTRADAIAEASEKTGISGSAVVEDAESGDRALNEREIEELTRMYAFPLTKLDHAILAQTDAEFHAHSWEELKVILETRDLAALKRFPSDLRRYLRWSADTRSAYGSVPNYVMTQRLHWTPLPSESADAPISFAVVNTTPFADVRDYSVLLNDWPYGMQPGIRHLIAWSKNRLETVKPSLSPSLASDAQCDANEGAKPGDITPRARALVDDFVERVIVRRIAEMEGARTDREEKARAKVMWFRNWTALQSVPGMEHVHVLLRDVDEGVVRELTGGKPVQRGDQMT